MPPRVHGIPRPDFFEKGKKLDYSEQAEPEFRGLKEVNVRQVVLAATELGAVFNPDLSIVCVALLRHFELRRPVRLIV